MQKDFAWSAFWSSVPECTTKYTALHYAIDADNYDAFKLLYKYAGFSFDTRFTEYNGNTLIHYILQKRPGFYNQILNDPDFYGEEIDMDLVNYAGQTCWELLANTKTSSPMVAAYKPASSNVGAPHCGHPTSSDAIVEACKRPTNIAP